MTSAVAARRHGLVGFRSRPVHAHDLIAVATAAAVLLGIALRLREYAFNRSLWLDELNLADNIISRGFVALTKPLAAAQAAPIGYLWLTRLSVNVFGVNEFSLRLVAVLGSLVALAVFALLARRLLPPAAAAVAAFLFATTPNLIVYSSEVKQYSTDVMAAVVLTYATCCLPARLRWTAAARFGLLAATLVWLSQPAIPVAFCCVAVVVARGVRRPRDVMPLLPGGAILGASVLVEYLVSLRRQSANATLQAHWKAGFPPSHGSRLGWLVSDLRSVLTDPFAMHATTLSLLLALVGLMTLIVRQSWMALALIGSVLLLAVLLAFAGVYPLRQRLALYLEPAAFLLLAAGLAWAPPWSAGSPELPRRARLTGTVVAALVALGLVGTAGSGIARGVTVLGRPIDITAGREAIAFVAGHQQPGDRVYSERAWAAPTFGYYGPRLHVTQSGTFSWAPAPAGGGACARPHFPASVTRVWIVFAHRASSYPTDRARLYLSSFAQQGTVEQSYAGYGGSGAYLLDLTRRPHSSAVQTPTDAALCVVLGRRDAALV